MVSFQILTFQKQFWMRIIKKYTYVFYKVNSTIEQGFYFLSL